MPRTSDQVIAQRDNRGGVYCGKVLIMQKGMQRAFFTEKQ